MILLEIKTVRYGAGQGELIVEIYGDEEGNLIKAIYDPRTGNTTWIDKDTLPF